MFKPLQRLAKSFRGQSLEEREFAYLSEATDRVDLEYRQRQIDKGLFSRKW